MTAAPTATSFALLGLLGIQSWTAYELVAQSKRSLHFFWPRSEAHLYAELKRLVERGHAASEVVEEGQRRRTRYTITSAGRAALEEWLGTRPSSPTLEVEGLVRMLLGDQGSTADLRSALETTAHQALAAGVEGRTVIADLLTTGGPLPDRLHLTERAVSFFAEFQFLVHRWCEETLTIVDTWPDTRGVGLTPEARERLEQLAARIDAIVEAAPTGE